MPLSPFKKNHRRQYLWITLFAIGMAFLESAVVIYLRALYYPEGFAFHVLPRPSGWGKICLVLKSVASVSSAFHPLAIR